MISIRVTNDSDDGSGNLLSLLVYISIHIVNNGDDSSIAYHERCMMISIHIANDGDDALAAKTATEEQEFQSTRQ